MKQYIVVVSDAHLKKLTDCSSNKGLWPSLIPNLDLLVAVTVVLETSTCVPHKA